MTATKTSKTEHKASNKWARRAKKESRWISMGFDLKGFYLSLRRLDRRLAIRRKEAAAWEQQCALEEKLFGEPFDRPASASPFVEKPFGIEVARRIQYRISADDTRDLSSIVVSLALFDGDMMLFACSGMPLPTGTTALLLTRFVTSSRLVTAYNDNRNRDDNLRIEVRFDGNTKTDGFLGLYDDQIAIVTTLGLPTLRAVDLNTEYQAPSRADDIQAFGRAFLSGSLRAEKGSLSENCPTWVSNHPITEAVFGGPVIGDDDRFIGMSLEIVDPDDVNRTNVLYLPTHMLRNRLEHFGILNPKKLDFCGYSLPSGVKSVVPSGFRKTINHIKALGYPMPPPLVLELNGKLLDRFEGYFGDILAWKGYRHGALPKGALPFVPKERVWGLLQKEVVSDISRRVVSLKSFRGHARYFACTGLLISWCGSGDTRSVILTSASLVRHNGDDIENNLRIEVFLPPDQLVAGTLEFFHLNYNIAVVSVDKNFLEIRPENIFDTVQMPSRKDLPVGRREERRAKVVAVGRDIEEGLLMASIGEVKQRYRGIDSGYLKLSSCKINKAGIGGPLINFGGSFVGMNFYDRSEGTPFLPRNMIVKVLERVIDVPLPSERCVDDRESQSPVHIQYGPRGIKKNWWLVPEPYWYHGELEVDRYALPKLAGRRLQ